MPSDLTDDLPPVENNQPTLPVIPLEYRLRYALRQFWAALPEIDKNKQVVITEFDGEEVAGNLRIVIDLLVFDLTGLPLEEHILSGKIEGFDIPSNIRDFVKSILVQGRGQLRIRIPESEDVVMFEFVNSIKPHNEPSIRLRLIESKNIALQQVWEQSGVAEWHTIRNMPNITSP